MDYVPSDYFPAYLDEGEAVLTKQENAMYRQLGGLQGMFALQNQQSSGSTMVDYERIGRMLGKEVHDAIDGSKVLMSDREVGNLVAPHVDKQNGTTIALKKRGAL